MYRSSTDVFRPRSTTRKIERLGPVSHVHSSTCRRRSTQCIINHDTFSPRKNPRHFQRHGPRIPQRTETTENARGTAERETSTMVRECFISSRSLRSGEMAGDWAGKCGEELDWEGVGDGKGLGTEFCGGIGWGFGNACIGYLDKGSGS